MRDTANEKALYRARVLARWNKRGPVIGRLRGILVAVSWAMFGVGVYLGSATLGSLYDGTGAWQAGRDETALATVHECRRVGPISSAGIGYWWVCDTTVLREDGTVDQIESQPGLFTGDDAGKQIQVVSACSGAGKSQSCNYGYSRGMWLGLVNVLRGMVAIALMAFAVFASAVTLVQAVLGTTRWYSFQDRIAAWRGKD